VRTWAALARTLAEFDLLLSSLVKVNVWLRRIEDLPEMAKGLNPLPQDGFPARMTATTAFIDDCLLMLEGVAYRG